MRGKSAVSSRAPRQLPHEKRSNPQVVEEPSSSGSDETVPVVTVDELERLDVVARSVLAFLGLANLGIGILDLVDTVVDEPSVENSDDSKGDAVGELDGLLRVRRGGAVGSIVEDDEEDHENDLVEDLSPSLHLVKSSGAISFDLSRGGVCAELTRKARTTLRPR